MAGPGGTEVGRVSIRVVPNTEDFRRRLREQLQKIDDIETDVSPKSSEFQRKLKDMLRRAERENKVEIDVEFDERRLARAARGMREALSVHNMPNFLNDMSRMDMIMRRVVHNAERIRNGLLRAASATRDLTKTVFNIRGHFEGVSRIIRTLPGHIGLIRFGNVVQEIDRGESSIRRFGTTARSAFRGVATLLGGLARLIGKGLRGLASGVGNVLMGLGRMFPRLLGGAIANIGTALKSLSSAFVSVGSVGTKAMGPIGIALTAILQAAIGLALTLAQVGAISLGLIVAGAAITASWGAVATAIAAIPAAIALIGVPLGLLMLDFDTLKQKIGELTPEFQKFRKEASEALAKGLAPALETFAKEILPEVKTNIIGVAEVMGQMAQETANWLKQGEGLELLKTMFQQVKETLESIKPGLADLGVAFLKLASNSAAFDVLTTAVNTFGSEFRAMVDELSQGQLSTLDQAFRGLEQIAGSLTRALVHLVRNGIELFAAAAPDISYFLDELTNFFDRFDWDALGESVGRVFRGLGDSLKNVPQETIDQIVAAFDEISRMFTDGTIERGIQTVLSMVPGVIRFAGEMAAAFLDAIAYVKQFGQTLEGLALIAEGSWEAIKQIFTLGFADGTFETAKQKVDAGWEKIRTAGEQGGHKAADAVRQKAEAFAKGIEEGLAKVPEEGPKALEGLEPAIKEKLKSVPLTARSETEKTGPAAQEGLSNLPPAVTEALTPAEQAMIEGLRGLAPQVQQGFADLEPSVAAGMATLAGGVQTGMAEVQKAFSDSMLTWPSVISGGLMRVEMEINSGILAWNTAISNGMTTIQTTITDAFTTQITTAVTQGMMNAEMEINSGVLNWNTALQNGMTALQTTLTDGWNLMATQAANGLMLVEQEINNAILAWNTALTNGFTVMQTTMTNGFTLMANSTANGLMLVEQEINSAILAWNTRLQEGMTTLQTTVQTGITNIANAVREGMTQIQDAFVVGWDTIGQRTTEAIQRMTDAVTQGMDRIRQSVTDGIQQCVDAVTNGMQQMSDAIKTGMDRAVREVDSAISRMVSALKSAVPKFRQAGANMGQALADGLNSKASTVEAAARRLANAAAAAMRAAAQIRSPSRVTWEIGEYLGLGLAEGMNDSRAEVRRASQGLVKEVIRASDGLSEAFGVDNWTDDLKSGVPSAVRQYSAYSGVVDHNVSGEVTGIADAVETALSGWSVEIDSNGIAKMVNKSNTRRNRRR